MGLLNCSIKSVLILTTSQYVYRTTRSAKRNRVLNHAKYSTFL
jgi:hypothetical protein